MATNTPSRSGLATRAYRWIFISGLVSALLAAFLQPKPRLTDFDAAMAAANAQMATFCLSPAIAAAGVLLFALVTGVTQRIARFYGGTGTYAELAHALAAFQAPLSPVLVLGLIALTPATGPRGFAGQWVLLAWLGLCALNTVAIRSVNRFGWGQAALTQVLVAASTLLLGAVVLFGLTWLTLIVSLAPALPAP